MILDENLSLLNFIDSDFVVINRPLNEIYQLELPEEEKLPKGSSKIEQDKKLRRERAFRKVMLDKESLRGGLITQAGVLMMTTNGEFTNPFYRGAWVAKSIYGLELKTPENLKIEALEAQHAQDPGQRILQKELAADITRRVHSQADLETAIAASSLLFGKSSKEAIEALPEAEFLSVFEGVPSAEVSKSNLVDGVSIIDLLSDATAFLNSKGEARRALKENSISVNKAKVAEDYTVTEADLISGKHILLQRGKKNYFLVRCT